MTTCRWRPETTLRWLGMLLPLFLIPVVQLPTYGQQDATPNVSTAREKQKGPASLSPKALESLTYEDLPKYGIVGPGKKDHARGKGLILLSLKATGYFKGAWVQAHGLLGTTMLQCDVRDYLAYHSMFASISVNRGYKLYASTLVADALLAEYQLGPGGFHYPLKKARSVVLRRESVIYSIAQNIGARFTFDSHGNWGRNYGPEPGRKSNEGLLRVFEVGVALFKELQSRGYKDKTLRDALGITVAVLEFDGTYVDIRSTIALGHPATIYRDALHATVAEMKRTPDHSRNFLQELGLQMEARGLAANDQVLLPDPEDPPENFLAMLAIIDQDLDAIEQRPEK